MPGTFITKNETCQQCPSNEFSNTSSARQCLPCSNGLFSARGSQQCGCPAGSYARLIGGKTSCLSCRQEKWCRAGANLISLEHQSLCIEGRTGIGCASCNKGYYSYNEQCIECETQTLNSMRYLFIVPIVALLFFLFKLSHKLKKQDVQGELDCFINQKIQYYLHIERLRAILLLSSVLTTFTWLQTATFITTINVSKNTNIWLPATVYV
jgi:hypothetical protein